MASTVNEAREQDGKEPMEDPLLGNAPLNPALTGIYLQKIQAAQQAQQGQPGQEGGQPEPGPDEEQTQEQEPTLQESGDRHEAPQGQPEPQVEEQGDRNGRPGMSAGSAHDPSQLFGTSSMMRKSRVVRAQDILVVG